ncbi:hypothetical protein [Prochlorococcus sp. MIT 0801]
MTLFLIGLALIQMT